MPSEVFAETELAATPSGPTTWAPSWPTTEQKIEAGNHREPGLAHRGGMRGGICAPGKRSQERVSRPGGCAHQGPKGMFQNPVTWSHLF